MNKFYFSIPNCHIEIKLKISGLYSSLFFSNKIFTNFPKKIGGGGNRKKPTCLSLVFGWREWTFVCVGRKQEKSRCHLWSPQSEEERERVLLVVSQL